MQKKKLNKLTLKLSQLAPNSFNPKRTERFQDETRRLATSMETFGQVLPILVREKDGGYEILNGYHRFKALEAKGETEVEVWNIGEIPDVTARAIVLSLEDSRIPLNRLKVASLVKGMMKKDLLPYSLADIKALEVLSGIDFSLGKEKEQIKSHRVLLPKSHWNLWDTKLAGRDEGEFIEVLLNQKVVLG